MKLLAVKHFLKKAWAWTKTHWYVPFIVILIIFGFVIWGVTKNAMLLTSMMDVLRSSRDSYKEQSEALESIHRKEIVGRNKVIEEYNKNLKALEEEYETREEELDSKKKKELKSLVEESYNDPEKLASEIARLYGFENG